MDDRQIPLLTSGIRIKAHRVGKSRFGAEIRVSAPYRRMGPHAADLDVTPVCHGRRQRDGVWMGRDPRKTPWKRIEASPAEPYEVPANRALPGLPVEDRVCPFVACHAGGRGFESGRSRSSFALQTTGFVVFLVAGAWFSGSKRAAA